LYLFGEFFVMTTENPPQLETLISRARQQGVRHDEQLPFLLTPNKPNGFGVLLVHGFTASPREMEPLAQVLTGLGFTTMGVRLPGHGTSPEDLAKRHQEEWQQAVEEGYLLLRQHTQQIFGVGLSTGALLLVALAARQPLEGLILLSPFLRVKHRLAPAAGLLRFAKKYQSRPVEPELATIYYDRRPLHGVHQLNRLCSQVRRLAGQVTAPALLINGAGDQTIRIDSSLELFHLLPSRHKVFHLYGPEVGHALTAADNPRRQELYTLIQLFLGAWTPPPQNPNVPLET
jgi:carboxylesterase